MATDRTSETGGAMPIQLQYTCNLATCNPIGEKPA